MTPLIVAARLLCPWHFPGKNSGVCCHLPSSSAIKPMSAVSPALASRFFTTEPPAKPMFTSFPPKKESPRDLIKLCFLLLWQKLFSLSSWLLKAIMGFLETEKKSSVTLWHSILSTLPKLSFCIQCCLQLLVRICYCNPQPGPDR